MVLVGDSLSRIAVAEATDYVADRVGVEVNPYIDLAKGLHTRR